MIWLAVIVLVALVVAVCTLIAERQPEIEPEEATRAAIELHAIRRRLDVATLRSELQRDAMHVRRELAEELRDLD